MRIERVDVCVIGSGAGGAVVAHEAARRGKKTLVLERGPWVRSHEMSSTEIDMIPRLYKDGGMQLNSGLDFFILQGACVGGSTVISNMVLMRPPNTVFDAWKRIGADLDVEEIHAAYDRVERLLGAQAPRSSAQSKSTALFERGARALGFEPKKMLKALGECTACGNCNIGCQFGAKRSALTTFVRWAEEAGARIISDIDVTKIHLRRGGHVDVVEGLIGPAREKVRVYAEKVVVAAGAIGSSALLLASGITKNVGRRLSFNVGAMMVGEFEERLDSFDADQMTTYVQQDGYLIEATHNPIMSAALTTPGWLAEHARLMHRANHLGYAGAMSGSEPVGRVVMSRWTGHEETRFTATPRDMHTLREGLKTIARTFFAGGAKRVFLPTETFTTLESPVEVSKIDTKIRVMRDIQCGSSHPQGGNAMSDDRAIGVVDTKFKVHGVDNLFVCDASVFPTSLAVNPMHTVMALANVGAHRILAA